jgi:hypothetical protein
MRSLTVEIVKPDNPIPYQIRYKVLVEENGFIRPDSMPSKLSARKMEKDVFDDYAFHIVVFMQYGGTRIPVGTGRVVLDSECGLPFYKVFIHNVDRKCNFICEVSRISILDKFKKTRALELIFAVAYIVSKYILNVDCAFVNANPDTNSICCANNIYMHLVENGFLHSNINCKPLNNSIISVHSSSLIQEDRHFTDIPHMIKKYLNMNFRITGMPIYISKYNMCGMPLALFLNEMNARYDKYFKKIMQSFALPDKNLIISNSLAL